ncbi:MAG: hypothetical protein A2W00_15410 [Candidatus Eisenbacteria bacterium RBG_16_71_46]|nr:MAG: hypothetical protein A2W00_15410 [Candidatus Eisenbacteria bacterium RBG_16_71_46]OGF22388.1 MAG: hypothetical protein A2V63_02910 [Candidatus Eisenbacteria bacterium RBG_19FT_COMBO_70_11]
MRATPHSRPRSERGATLLELMIALVVLSIGILAVSQLFPAGARTQVQDRLQSTANYYAREKVEQLSLLVWTDASLTVGRHPSGSGTESLGSTGALKRYYRVDSLAAPLDNLRRITVTVRWQHQKMDSVQAVTYVRQ